MTGAGGHSAGCEKNLLSLARRGDEDAISSLLNRYEAFIRKRASAFQISGLETEDLVQEGKIGLLTAVHTYDIEKSTVFSAFAQRCIVNRMRTAARAAVRQKHLPLNNSVSLSDLREADTARFASVAGPEEDFVRQERLGALRAAARSLSPRERRLLSLYLSGLSYSAMARKLRVDAKYIDNALQRMKHKLSLRLVG